MLEQLTTLRFDNGLRMVHIHCSDSHVEYCGTAVRVGSRDEDSSRHGLAHFVEHTIFKGTIRRSASRIINHMEAVGGELNAYTTKEETYVYSVFPRGNFRRAVDLIADLILNSQFPDRELDKEREVVAEEIDSYLDSPSEAVFDDFDDLIFKGCSLGHNILGSRKTLDTFNSSTCLEFVRHYYSAPNMVFFYLGHLPSDKVASLVESRFNGLPDHEVKHDYRPADATLRFDERRRDADNHQAHTVMGCIVPSFYSEERFALSLLNNILGGPGMNSRLNVSLRERRGLVYSVDSTLSLYTDLGLISIYSGCNPEDNNRCIALIRKELDKISSQQLSPRTLEAAKRQYLGQQIVASASLEQIALGAARSMLFTGEILTREQVVARINTLTPDSVAKVAAYLNPSRFSILTLG